MIIKSIIGRGFKGCVEYVLTKQGAKLLGVYGVRTDRENMINDFKAISKLRPTLGKPVWHAPISFAYADNIDDQMMLKIAEEYLENIGLKSNQYMIVRHSDTDHQHLHIVANRVGFDGSVVSDKFCRNRSARISDILENKYGLTIAREARKGKRDLRVTPLKKVKGKAMIKREVKEFIRNEIFHCLNVGTKSLESLKLKLSFKQIEMRVQFNTSKEVTGISFRAKGLALKGSQIHSDLRAKKLLERLVMNTSKKSLKQGLGI
ncbi:MAG TPA: relaxase/mobilization nuclease domain-containing protein [Cyclobacteriaceae bacterium]|nr:relaxase/mobilization nuclease domain-containing protein [Cyclobacteriaceae bacterium]HRJ80684.1 relaxase/mobilization nuclease domain-containing protein [Cyclobacteriaceae bacterium]